MHKYNAGDKVMYKTYLVTIVEQDGFRTDQDTPIYRIKDVPLTAIMSTASKTIAFEYELSECLVEDGNITYVI